MVIYRDVNMNIVWANIPASEATGQERGQIIVKPFHESFGDSPGSFCEGCLLLITLQERRPVKTIRYRKMELSGMLNPATYLMETLKWAYGNQASYPFFHK